MLDIVMFSLMRLLTRKFWFLVVATLFGVFAMWVRSSVRNDIFKAAAETVGKQYR